jgi:crotonobetainyl-CoA:carnitine CoA-transferase CaiB-like acyl-CoA transferase
MTMPTASQVGTAPTGPALGDTLPLTGIRVLDLTMVWAGPFATKLLADLGAEVIKVEGAGRLDLTRGLGVPDPDVEQPWNNARYFNEFNRNKYDIALDPRTEAGKRILFDLALASDIVIDNFRPHVVERMGLSWDRLHAENSRVSMISMPAYSSHAGEDKLPGYGPNVEEMSGITHFTGYLGEAPHKLGISYGDPVAGLGGAAAALLTIWNRERTGEGIRMEVSQRNLLISLIGEAIVAAQLGREPQRMGNRHPLHAPQGVYPTRDERWVALTVQSDDAWSRFAQLAGITPRADLGAAVGRQSAHDELDEAIAAWSSQLEGAHAVEKLRAAGVAASLVADARDFLDDPVLVERRFLAEVPHESLGTMKISTPSWRFEESQREVHRAPFLGEHNEDVLRRVLGYSSEQIEQLRAEGVIADAPLGGAK